MYDYLVLEEARQLDEAGFPVLNPRNVDDRSLFTSDRVFMAEKALHAQWIQYKRDTLKAAKAK